jgi:hypothetical protein
MGLLGFSILAFVGNVYTCLAASLLLLLGALLCGMALPSLLRGSRALLVMGLLVCAFRSLHLGEAGLVFSLGGLVEGLLFMWKLLLAFSAAALFFACTRISAVREAAARINPYFGLALSLMLSFLPLFFEAWTNRKEAWLSRAGRMNVRGLALLLPSVLEYLMLIAVKRAIALEARGTFS